MLGDIDEPTLPFGLSEVTGNEARAILQSGRLLSADLNQRLRAQARRLGVSLASLCHLAWGQVLARSSGRESVVFGTVLLGRMHAGAGAERALGLFINTLPLRLDLDEVAVETSVRRTHERLAELLQHEHASLALAQRCSGIAAPAPLFSALLNYRHNPLPSGEPGGSIQRLGGAERTNYPLTLSVEDFGSALGLTVQVVDSLSPQYLSDLMQAALEHLAHALEHTPQLPTRELDILPPAERQRLLRDCNATATPFPDQLCLHQLFETQVLQSPGAIALVQGEVQLTYGQLNQRANQLAEILIARGVRPDARVALCVQRRPHMVIGLLGILKAGGAYVPLEPSYPRERLRELLQDAQPLWLLTDEPGRLALGAELLASQPNLALDLLADAAEPGPQVNPQALGLQPTHAAYVIYTSGSTGRPKGVLVTHAGLRNYVSWAIAKYPLAEGGSSAVNTSISFDATVTSLFPPLLAGRGVTLLGEHEDIASPRISPPEPFSLLSLAPAHLALMNQGIAPENRARLARCLVIGGEALNRAAVAQWLESAPDSRIFNEYGPTETVVACTSHQVHPTDLESDSIPIGRPIWNTQIHVLDARLRPVPVGVTGELYIAGAGLARGYWNRPELTAECFVANPFGPPGSRLYRSGDLARYRLDGNLEFLGRADHQVKLRGFRIEPGEIETHLAKYLGVLEAAVVVREDTPGDARLVAYFTAQSGFAAEALDLREHLAARLPEYSLPTAFVRLTRLPLTPNDKLDRKALPAPDARSLVQSRYEPPVGETEQAVAAIWSELLGVARIGRHDHFFQLGGHSLLAVHLIEQLRRAGLSLQVRELFTHPRLSDLVRAAQPYDDFLI
jgi:amino acid adenylation domain-containing protein